MIDKKLIEEYMQALLDGLEEKMPDYIDADALLSALVSVTVMFSKHLGKDPEQILRSALDQVNSKKSMKFGGYDLEFED